MSKSPQATRATRARLGAGVPHVPCVSRYANGGHAACLQTQQHSEIFNKVPALRFNGPRQWERQSQMRSSFRIRRISDFGTKSCGKSVFGISNGYIQQATPGADRAGTRSLGWTPRTCIHSQPCAAAPRGRIHQLAVHPMVCLRGGVKIMDDRSCGYAPGPVHGPGKPN